MATIEYARVYIKFPVIKKYTYVYFNFSVFKKF